MNWKSLRHGAAGAILGLAAFPIAAQTQCFSLACPPVTSTPEVNVNESTTPATSSPGISGSQQQGTIIAPLLLISKILSMNRGGGLSPAGAPGPVARAGETGLAGAVQGPRWNGWVAVANSRVDYSWAPLATSGDVTSVVAGADYRLGEKATLGVSLAVDESHIDTRYNNGRLTGTGVNVAPYFAWQFNDAWSLDASAGTGRARPQMVDNVAATTGSTVAKRLFGALNLNYSRWLGNWELSGKGTLIQSREEKNQFQQSNGTLVASSTTGLGQLRLGGQVAYYTAGGINPYAGIAYVSDYHYTDQVPVPGAALPANDRTGWVYTLGVNLFSKGALSGGVQFQKEDRREQKLNSVLANLAIRF